MTRAQSRSSSGTVASSRWSSTRCRRPSYVPLYQQGIEKYWDAAIFEQSLDREAEDWEQL